MLPRYLVLGASELPRCVREDCGGLCAPPVSRLRCVRVALVRPGTRSIGNFALNVSRDRLEEIYAMSDGEDEKVIEYSAADEQEFPAQYSLTEYVN